MNGDFGNQLRAALHGMVASIGRTEQRIVRLTRGDGTGNLITMLDGSTLPDRDIWVNTDGAGGREVFPVILPDSSFVTRQNNIEYEKLWVKIGKEAGESRYTILGPSTAAGMYSLSPGTFIEQALAGAYLTAVANIATLRASVLTSTQISIVGPYVYTNPDSGELAYYGSFVLDLADDIAALGALEERVLWLCLETTTGLIKTAPGPILTAAAVPAQGDFNYADITAIDLPRQYKRIIPIYIYAGETAAAEADFYRNLDARLEFPQPSALLSPAAVLCWNDQVVCWNDQVVLR